MIDLTATTEQLAAARRLGACQEALEEIQAGQEVTEFSWLFWVDNHYEKLPVPASAVPFCLYATEGYGHGIGGYGRVTVVVLGDGGSDEAQQETSLPRAV